MKLTDQINEFVAQAAVDIGVLVFPIVACGIVALMFWNYTKPPADWRILALVLPVLAVLTAAGYVMYSEP